MTRQEGHIIAERPELLANRGEKCVVIPTWKIGAADGPLKQDITYDRHPVDGMKKNNVTRRMAGAMTNLQFLRSDRYPVAFIQPTIRFEHVRGR